MTAKRTVLRWHIWAGLVVGLFWAVQGLTGALLAFNRDIQAATLDAGNRGARLPLDTLIARAGAAMHAKVTRLETFGPDRDLLLAYAGDEVGVVDARSGALLDRRDPRAMLPRGGGSWGWVLRLHEALLGGDRGQIVVGVSGIVLLLSVAVGLWNALPYRHWRPLVRMTQARGARQRLVGWHRLSGLIAAPALLAMASAGIYLAFAPELRPLLAAELGYRLPFKPASHAGAPTASIAAETAYAAARRRFPGATLVRLTLPSAATPVYLFRLLQPDDERRWAGTSTVAIDPANGSVIDAYDARTGPLANRVTDAVYSFHTGDVAGVPGRMAILLAGLALPMFAVTGWLSWARVGARRVR